MTESKNIERFSTLTIAQLEELHASGLLLQRRHWKNDKMTLSMRIASRSEVGDPSDAEMFFFALSMRLGMFVVKQLLDDDPSIDFSEYIRNETEGSETLDGDEPDEAPTGETSEGEASTEDAPDQPEDS